MQKKLLQEILVITVIALFAVFVMIAPAYTGAVTTSATALSVSVSGTHGTLLFKNYDRKSVKIPLTYDDGAVYLGKDDDIIYVNGQTCTDCVGKEFLALKDNYGHLMKITKLENGVISIKDSTYGKYVYDNPYTEGAPLTLSIGDITIVLTIVGNSVTFTDIGTSTVKLYDKGTLEIGSDFVYRELQGTTFSAEKYIGRGGSDPLTITVYYDTNVNSLRISSAVLQELTKTLGSGWYNTKGTYSFYSNKGTLITFTKYKVSVSK